MKKGFNIFGILVVVAVIAFGVVSVNKPTVNAEVEGQVGYLDKHFIIESYAGPQISAVIYEQDRLQAKFDQETAELNDEEKQQLFAQYQVELRQFEQRIGLPRLFDEISEAIHASAEAHGVSLVLDQEAVVLGGVDMTVDVLRRLGLLQEPNQSNELIGPNERND